MDIHVHIYIHVHTSCRYVCMCIYIYYIYMYKYNGVCLHHAHDTAIHDHALHCAHRYKERHFLARGHNKEFVNVLGKNHCILRKLFTSLSRNFHVQSDRYFCSSVQSNRFRVAKNWCPFRPFHYRTP